MESSPNQSHLMGHAHRVSGENRVRSVRELEALQQLRDAPFAHVRRHTVEVTEAFEGCDRGVALVQPRLVRNDVQPPSNLIQYLRQAQAIEVDQAGVRPQDAAKAAQGGGLAGAVLSQEYEDLAALDVKVHPVDGAHVAKALAKAFDSNHWVTRVLESTALPPRSGRLIEAVEQRLQPRHGRDVDVVSRAGCVQPREPVRFGGGEALIGGGNALVGLAGLPPDPIRLLARLGQALEPRLNRNR